MSTRAVDWRLERAMPSHDGGIGIAPCGPLPVRLIKGRGVAVAQAARDPDLHENVLRYWASELSA